VHGSPADVGIWQDLGDFCFFQLMVFMNSEIPYGGLLHGTYRC